MWGPGALGTMKGPRPRRGRHPTRAPLDTRQTDVTVGIVLLILLALALLIFGIIGTIKIAAWLLLFIILGVVILAIVGWFSRRSRA